MSVSCDLWLNLLKEENHKVNSKNFSKSVADETVQLLCGAFLYISIVNLSNRKGPGLDKGICINLRNKSQLESQLINIHCTTCIIYLCLHRVLCRDNIDFSCTLLGKHGLTVFICKYDLVFVPGKQDICLGHANVNNK